MSIINIKLDTFKQVFDVSNNNKAIYGEVHTDFTVVNKILDLIPSYYYTNPSLKWLDPCSGRGYFPMVLYKKLYNSLSSVITDNNSRSKHILSKNIFINEINLQHKKFLIKLFGEKNNVSFNNFLDISQKFDVIYGNPPFNINGSSKTPTNKKLKKNLDGTNAWVQFIKHSISLLKPNGLLAFITPSIWMKNDYFFHSYMKQFEILKIVTLDNTQTNKAFHGHAQTPTSLFLLQKKPSSHKTLLFDNIHQRFTLFDYSNCSIPLSYVSIINKFKPFVAKYGSIKVIKTSMRPGYKGLIVGPSLNGKTGYPNIKSCKLNGLKPQLAINFSNIKCSYCGIPKIVLAHKMHGFPYPDLGGLFGISNRDNYVILKEKKQDLLKIYKFLSNNFFVKLFEATRYRMKYLERHIFDFIPDISNIPDFPENISLQSIYNFFQINELERNFIEQNTKKHYEFF